MKPLLKYKYQLGQDCSLVLAGIVDRIKYFNLFLSAPMATMVSDKMWVSKGKVR